MSSTTAHRGGGPVAVVTAVSGPTESAVASALSGRRELVLVRRCADVAELLSVAEAGLAAVAVLGEAFPSLDGDVVDRLRHSGCAVLGVVDPDRESSERLRAWGVTVVDVDPAAGPVPAGPTAQRDAVLARAVLAAVSGGAGTGPSGRGEERDRAGGSGADATGAPGGEAGGRGRDGGRSRDGGGGPDGGRGPDGSAGAGGGRSVGRSRPGGYSSPAHGRTNGRADDRADGGSNGGLNAGLSAGLNGNGGLDGADGGAPSGAGRTGSGDPLLDPVPERRGRLVAVWGPAGAPGRTTVAVGVAAELAAGGAEVLLVDADTYAASIAQVLGLLDESPGLVAAVRAGLDGRLDPATLARLAPVVAPRLRVLTGLTRAARWSELRPAGLQAVWASARRLVDHVVVDLAPPLEEDDELSYDTAAPRRNGAALDVLRAADDVLVVGSADPVGLQRLVRGLQDLAVAVPGVAPQVVVNRVRADAVGRNPRLRVREALERFAGVRDLRLVPDDRPATDRALLSGRTLQEAAPDSAASAALRAAAAGLATASDRGPSTRGPSTRGAGGDDRADAPSRRDRRRRAGGR